MLLAADAGYFAHHGLLHRREDLAVEVIEKSYREQHCDQYPGIQRRRYGLGINQERIERETSNRHRNRDLNPQILGHWARTSKRGVANHALSPHNATPCEASRLTALGMDKWERSRWNLMDVD